MPPRYRFLRRASSKERALVDSMTAEERALLERRKKRDSANLTSPDAAVRDDAIHWVAHWVTAHRNVASSARIVRAADVPEQDELDDEQDLDEEDEEDDEIDDGDDLDDVLEEDEAEREKEKKRSKQEDTEATALVDRIVATYNEHGNGRKRRNPNAPRSRQ